MIEIVLTSKLWVQILVSGKDVGGDEKEGAYETSDGCRPDQKAQSTAMGINHLLSIYYYGYQ